MLRHIITVYKELLTVKWLRRVESRPSDHSFMVHEAFLAFKANPVKKMSIFGRGLNSQFYGNEVLEEEDAWIEFYIKFGTIILPDTASRIDKLDSWLLRRVATAWITGHAKGVWPSKCLKCGTGPATQNHALVCSGLAIDFNTEGSLMEECIKSVELRKMCFGHIINL